MLTPFQLSDVITRETVNQRINEYNAMFPLKIENGGTGATTAEQARKNLGIYRPDAISFTGDQTLTLAKSIRGYSYVVIDYSTNYDISLKPYITGGETHFTVDVMPSTTVHALSEETRLNYWSGSPRYLVFSSAIMRVDGNGYNINLERNQCMVVNLDTYAKSLDPSIIDSSLSASDFKIKITEITGYK